MAEVGAAFVTVGVDLKPLTAGMKQARSLFSRGVADIIKGSKQVGAVFAPTAKRIIADYKIIGAAALEALGGTRLGRAVTGTAALFSRVAKRHVEDWKIIGASAYNAIGGPKLVAAAGKALAPIGNLLGGGGLVGGGIAKVLTAGFLKVGPVLAGTFLKAASVAKSAFGTAASYTAKAFSGALRTAGGIAAGIGSAGLKIGGAGAVGIVGALGAAVVKASSLGESMQKAEIVFGKSIDQITRATDKMANRFGIDRQEFIDSASAIGLIGKASGLSQDQAAGLGVQFTKLAIDASSFYNIPLADALQKMRAGLVGEAEPLRTLGVLLNEAQVKAEGLRLGFKLVNGQFTEGEKVQARAAIITRQMADAHGDLARTSGSFANRMREAWGRLQNLAVTIGGYLLPVAQKLNDVLIDALKGAAGWAEKNQGLIAGWASQLNAVIEQVGIIYRNLGKFKEIAGLQLANIGDYLKDSFKAAISYLNDAIPYIAAKLGDALRVNIQNGLKSVLDHIPFLNINIPFARANPQAGGKAPEFHPAQFNPPGARADRLNQLQEEIGADEAQRAGMQAAREAQARRRKAREALGIQKTRTAEEVEAGAQAIRDAAAGGPVQGFRNRAQQRAEHQREFAEKVRIDRGEKAPRDQRRKGLAQGFAALAREGFAKTAREQAALGKEDMAKARKELEAIAAGPDKEAAKKAKEALKATKEGKEKAQEPEFVAFAELSKKIQLAALGGKDPAEETATNTEKMLSVLEEIRDKKAGPGFAEGPA